MTAPPVETYPREGSANADVYKLPLHLAVGMFDGVHLGHRAVIRQAMAAAKKEGHTAAVLTFDPHPSKVLYPEMATLLLMPLRTRISDMHAVGADYVFVQSFTREYAMQHAEEFVPRLQRQFPGLKSIHVGENFRFGSGRSGNIDTLLKSAAPIGIEVQALERKRMDGLAISSSRIRTAMIEGSIDEVNAMLGHPYTASGRVVAGRGIGRDIQFPTLNIPWHPEVRPRFGVYQVNLLFKGSAKRRRGVANYGLRPTVSQEKEPLLEVHLLDDEAISAGGNSVRVEFLSFMRPERQFPDLESLRRQIAADVAQVQAIPPEQWYNPAETA